MVAKVHDKVEYSWQAIINLQNGQFLLFIFFLDNDAKQS